MSSLGKRKFDKIKKPTLGFGNPVTITVWVTKAGRDVSPSGSVWGSAGRTSDGNHHH